MPSSALPCSLPVLNQTRRPTLDATAATAEAAARTTRHLDMCRELAELGMAIARATATQALAAETTPAATETTRRTADYPLAFARISRAVRQCIALEAQLSAPAGPKKSGRPLPQRPPPDPRRATIKRALTYALDHPDQPHQKADIADHLEECLASDPDQTIPIDTILNTLCNEHALTLDYAHMPTDLLDDIIEHADADPPQTT